MSQESTQQRRWRTTSPAAIPRAPPLPAPKPLQRARDAASRFLGYSPQPQDSPGVLEDDRFTHGSSAFTRSSSIGESQNATTSHRTGLPIHTISINDSGSHAIVAGRDIFKTVKIKDGHCAEDFNLRTAIRSTPTQASGQPRKVYSIDIADVAWAKGDSGDYVAAATSSGKIIVYDLGHAGLQAAQLHEHYRHVHNITFNPHRGSLLLSGSQDGTVRLWDLRDLRNSSSQTGLTPSKRKYSGLSDGVRDVKWSPVEGYDFAFATDSGDIQRWDMRNLKAAKVRVPAHSLGCNTVDWHPDGKHIVSAGSDQTVRVFDVSAARPRKALWEIKTAFPVMHARWRPSCQSSMPLDNGAQQCTQIVTSYGKDHPVMHVWDFRRPLLPFRELQPYASAPTDLLWHSQDLLWTVGREGVFMQTDIQHAPKVIDRCCLQVIDVSPLSEMSFVAQARHQRRIPKPQPVPSLQPRTSSGLSTNSDGSFLSRSWADDSLDHSFLSVLPFKHKARSNSKSRVHHAFGSSTYNHNLSATIKLDDILLNRKSFRPHQMACRGQLPTQHNQPSIVAFMAQGWKTQIPESSGDDKFLEQVKGAFKMNEDCAQAAGLLITAQTWKIVGHCTMTHLRDRIQLKRRIIAEKQALPQQDLLTTSIENLATRLAAQHLKSPTQSPGTMRPVSTIAQHLTLPESTSNVPTPVARPSSRGHHHASHHRTPLPDPDHDELIVLPPSLADAHIRPPPDPAVTAPVRDRRLTVGNLEDLQKIELFNDQSDRHDMVKRWSSQPKAPLDLDPVDADGVKIPPSKFAHYGSGESFQFLEESAGSRGSSFPASLESKDSPQMHMVNPRPTRPKPSQSQESFPAALPDHDEISSAHQSMFFEGSDTLAHSALTTKENSGNVSLEASTHNLRDEDETDVHATNFAPHANGSLLDPKPLFSRPEMTTNNDSGVLEAQDDLKPQLTREPPRRVSAKSTGNVILSAKPESPVDSGIDEAEMDLELNKTWTVVEMLRQLIHFYTVEEPYAQMGAVLLLLLGSLLPRTHPRPASEIHQTISSYVDYFLTTLGWEADDIPMLSKQSFEQPLKAGLQPLQIESVLSTYHEQLLAYQLFDEAAVVRKLAYPAYPAVYEDFIKDCSVYFMCSQCGKSIKKNVAALRCQSCTRQQCACPICWETTSPYESNDGSHLFSSCLLCGHSGHAACFEEWFISCKGQSCPAEGCLCDCVAGKWRDEKEALAEKEAKMREHGRVEEDEWMAKESKAVHGVRKLIHSA